MSKCMQLKVTVAPIYRNDMEDAYPNLASRLSSLASELVKRNPSLYEIAGQLDRLLYVFDGTALREVLLRYRDDLRSLHKTITENIADWNLAQADRLLYQMEDIFDKIESELE